MHETLIAYVEGTLSSEERVHVQRRLHESTTWQHELSQVEQVQTELRCQMPLIGRTSNRQLDALLPEILAEARGPESRTQAWWKGLQIISVLTCFFTLLLAVPLVIQSASASAQDAWSPNVPKQTSTPHHNAPDAIVVARETEEPEYVFVALMSVRTHMDVPVICEASPVPMPLSTRAPGR